MASSLRWAFALTFAIAAASHGQELKGLPEGGAEPPVGSESTWEITLAQAPLVAAANALAATLHAVRPIEQPDKRPLGFASIELYAFTGREAATEVSDG